MHRVGLTFLPVAEIDPITRTSVRLPDSQQFAAKDMRRPRLSIRRYTSTLRRRPRLGGADAGFVTETARRDLPEPLAPAGL